MVLAAEHLGEQAHRLAAATPSVAGRMPLAAVRARSEAQRCPVELTASEAVEASRAAIAPLRAAPPVRRISLAAAIRSAAGPLASAAIPSVAAPLAAGILRVPAQAVAIPSAAPPLAAGMAQAVAEIATATKAK